MNFSEKARAMRMKSPLTLREIGEQCNVSESMVSRYISGAAKPPDDVAEKILEVLRNSEQDDDRGIYAAHIDDLRRYATLEAVWFSHDPMRRECLWAAVLAEVEAPHRRRRTQDNGRVCISHVYTAA